MHLHLVRHPLPKVNPGVCYGHLDLELAGPASLAAQRISGRLPSGLPLWTSPARRCRELALCLHPRPMEDARLLEMHFGDWEGQDWDDIDRTALDAWAAHPASFVIPGGESGFQVQARALALVKDLADMGIGEAIWVTHGGIMRALLAWQQQLPETLWPELRFDYEEILTLNLELAAP